MHHPITSGGGPVTTEVESWRRAFKTPFIPKGVYRFKTHEEADAWTLKMLTRIKP